MDLSHIYIVVLEHMELKPARQELVLLRAALYQSTLNSQAPYM